MSVELQPFCHEAEVAIADGGLILRMTMDFGVIDRLEGVLGRPMDELIAEMFTNVSMQGKFLWQMTRKHHSDVSLDQIAGVLFSKDGPSVMAVLGALVRNVFNFADDAPEGEQSPRPPKRSGGASRGSSKNGARRSSALRTSGRKPRVRS